MLFFKASSVLFRRHYICPIILSATLHILIFLCKCCVETVNWKEWGNIGFVFALQVACSYRLWVDLVQASTLSVFTAAWYSSPAFSSTTLKWSFAAPSSIHHPLTLSSPLVPAFLWSSGPLTPLTSESDHILGGYLLPASSTVAKWLVRWVFDGT